METMLSIPIDARESGSQADPRTGFAINGMGATKTHRLDVPPKSSLSCRSSADIASAAGHRLNLDSRRAVIRADANALVQKFAEAFDTLSEPLLIGDGRSADWHRSRIVYVNPAFERLCGYSSLQLLGKTVGVMHGERTSLATLRRIDAAIAARRPVSEEVINYRADGSTFRVELGLVPIADQNESYTHWIATYQDISKQEVSRVQLQQSEERLRLLTEALPALVWTASADGFCEYVSQSCADFMGVPAKDCHGYGWSEFIHPDDKAAVYTAWTAAVANETTFATEYRLRRKDGVYVWFLHRATPLRALDGSIREWIGASTDISAYRQCEQALRQSEKLAAVGRLASAISHEINNPLEGLMNLLYLLETSSSLDEGSRGYLKAAQEQVSRISEVTTHSLRFHRQSTNATTRRVSDILESLLILNRPRLESKAVKVRCNYWGDSSIPCFAGEVRQALGNVLANAIEALGTEGVLRVRVRPAQEWTGDHRTGLLVTVSENGCGIDKADLSKVCDAFYTTKGMSGTGLGLFITRQIMDRHKGSLRIRSSRHLGRQGTTVMMFFPKEEPCS